MTLAMFAAGFGIAFYKGWLMTLVCLCSLPVMGICGYVYASAIANQDKEQEEDYSDAGAKA